MLYLGRVGKETEEGESLIEELGFARRDGLFESFARLVVDHRLGIWLRQWSGTQRSAKERFDRSASRSRRRPEIGVPKKELLSC